MLISMSLYHFLLNLHEFILRRMWQEVPGLADLSMDALLILDQVCGILKEGRESGLGITGTRRIRDELSHLCCEIHDRLVVDAVRWTHGTKLHTTEAAST
jgi:hypothetical protein